jgi:DNA primase
MLKTRTLISKLEDVPVEWIFENYLSLPEQLSGQDVKIFSVFREEKTPSMFIYYDTEANKYKFKDFSTGKGGSALYLVKELYNFQTFFEPTLKIIQDYNNYIDTNGKFKIKQFKVHSKYKVTKFVLRHWNNFDKKYWSQFRIGSRILDKYNVIPLESYTMTKEDDDETKKLVIKGGCIYGYFDKKGELYKVYQPLTKDNKFINVKNHIQGDDQIKKAPYLVICSSLKDVMAFDKLNFLNAEAVAPNSENTLISEKKMLEYLEQYDNVCTLFDNDEAGLKAMQKYKDKYGIEGVRLQLEKDLSDSIRDHGLDNTRLLVYPLLTKALTGKVKQLEI